MMTLPTHTKSRFWMRKNYSNGDSVLVPALFFSESDIYRIMDHEIKLGYNTKNALYKQAPGSDLIACNLSWVDGVWRILGGEELVKARADLEKLV